MKKFYIITGLFLLALIVFVKGPLSAILLTLSYLIILGIFFLPGAISKFLFSLKNRLLFSHILASIIPTLLVVFLVTLFMYIMLASFTNSLVIGWVDLKLDELRAGMGREVNFPIREGFEGMVEGRDGFYIVVFRGKQRAFRIDREMPGFFRREYQLWMSFPPVLYRYEDGKMETEGRTGSENVKGISIPVIYVGDVYSEKTGKVYYGAFFEVKATPSSFVKGLLKGKGVIGSRMFLVFLLLAVLFSFVNLAAMTSGIWISRDVARGVEELSFAVRAVRGGDLSVRITSPRKDQLGQLLSDFNAMVERLAQLVEREKSASELEHELKIARKIQLKLLPPQRVAIPGIDYAALTLAAKGVGGDFYDIIEGEGWFVAMADVSGKGLHSSLYGAMLKGTLLALLASGEGLQEAVVRANALLYPYLRPNYFITLSLLRFDHREVEFLRAGHTPLILHRPVWERGIDRLEYLVPEGMGIGLVENLEGRLKTVRFSLSPGDSVLLFTDGLSELPSKDGKDLFGVERIGAILRKYHSLSPKEIITRLLREAEAFSGREIPPDDIAIFLARAR